MRGFTLLEMLVALCIAAALTTTLVVSAWPDRRARVEEEARRLAMLVELAATEARASGQAIAWSPQAGGYGFWQRGEDGEWTRFPATSIYTARSLEGVAIAGERAVLSPHGLLAPLEAALWSGDVRFLVRSEALGGVSIHRVHAR